MKKTIKIIDLFAGIGGIRLGVERAAKSLNVGVKCVFTSEIDKHACITYRKNFPKDTHDPENDITKIKEREIPDFDLLLAGFPCQAFSIAGRRGGFNDTRGTLFFDIARILKEKKPAAFLLENVKGLKNHDHKRTLETILNVLRFDLGYNVPEPRILNSKNYGVPQNRERIYIVGFENGGGGFQYPDPLSTKKYLEDILEEKTVSVKYYLSNAYLRMLKNHRKRHEEKGHGFGYEIIEPKGIANAIVVGGMGRERNLVIDKRLKDLTPMTNIKGTVNRQGIRRMTPVEWERLQGFPDNYTEGVADVQRFKQLGNAVTVPVIEQVSLNLMRELLDPHPFNEVFYSQTKLAFDEIQV